MKVVLLLIATALVATRGNAEYNEEADDGKVYVLLVCIKNCPVNHSGITENEEAQLILGSRTAVVVPYGKFLIADPAATTTSPSVRPTMDVGKRVTDMTEQMDTMLAELQTLTNDTNVAKNVTGTLFDGLAQLTETVRSEVGALVAANQTVAVAIAQLTATMQEMSITHAADVATITSLLNRIIPQDSNLDLGCKVSAWSNWGTCSQPCGLGKRTRTREVEKVGLLADPSLTCPSASETEGCELKACPVDCKIGDWSDWHGCIPSCGPGSEKSRYRRITTLGKHNGKPCGGVVETVKCNATCPADSCQGGIFKTVAELAKFEDCTFVSGSIEIVNLKADSDEDRAAMAGYTKGVAEVTGSVKLFHCDGVHDLSMFAGLTRLGGSVEVSTNLPPSGGDVIFSDLRSSAFSTYDGLNAVTTVGGKVSFDSVGSDSGTDGVVSQEFKMFASLERISGGGLSLKDLGYARIWDFHGSFAKLDYVGGNVYIKAAFALCIKTKLFPKLTKVDGPDGIYIGQQGSSTAIAYCTSPGVWFPELESVMKIDLQYLRSFDIAGAFPKLKQCPGLIRAYWLGFMDSSAGEDSAFVPPFGALLEVGTLVLNQIYDRATKAEFCPSPPTTTTTTTTTPTRQCTCRHCGYAGCCLEMCASDCSGPEAVQLCGESGCCAPPPTPPPTETPAQGGDCKVDISTWFPQLRSVTASISITYGHAITAVGFKSLETVASSVSIYLNKNLESIDFNNKLVRAAKFKIDNNPRLTMCRKEFNTLMNSVTQSSTADQIQPGTILDC